MKVDFQCGDTITIPEGCKAIVKDGSVVFEREEKTEVKEFKDGDVLVNNGKYERFPFIFKGDDNKGFHKFYASLGYYGHLIICEDDTQRCGNSRLSLATEEEKALLFDKMKEQGLKWNAEEKRVENIRWRAKRGEGYYFIDNSVHIQSHQEDGDGVDNQLWNAYNYFRTREQAKKAAEVVKEVLRKFHEEIGE